MRNNKNNIMRLFAFASIVITMAGCMKETFVDQHESGTRIRFGASTEWLNSEATRTEYSGKDEYDNNVNVNSTYERIDWVTEKDRIRVLCNAASGGSVFSGTGNDYVLKGTPTIDGKKSIAEIEPIDGDGLQWGTGDHYFYAFYPAPGTESNYAFTNNNPVADPTVGIEPEDGNKAMVAGVIPASQEVIKVGNEFKVNMNYAYMYAATKVSSGSTGSVPLSFMPLVTSFEFTFKRMESDPMTMNLTKVELSAPDGQLSGEFNAELSFADSGQPNVDINVVGTAGNKITVQLPDGGILLTDEPVKVNILTLPVEQKYLTLTLYFGADGATKRTLELKDASLARTGNQEGWVIVGACKKAYINNVAAPGSMWTYTLDVTGSLTNSSVPVGGGNVTYNVVSYRTNTTNSTIKQPVRWSAYFSIDGNDWSSTIPEWLLNFTRMDEGSISSTSYTARASANDNEPVWEGSTIIVADTKAAARDLSCYDIYGVFTGGVEGNSPFNTANCYVVSAPGWYRIPCVYGNAIKNGADNPTAYTGPSTGTGILTGGFLNHANAPITSPWIKDNKSGTDSTSPNITIDGAGLLWQDTQNLITQVEYEDDYIYFYVDNIFQGNAVITAKQGDTIVWSWHIWSIENPASRLEAKWLYSHPTTNTSVQNPAKVLPVNLGYCDAEHGRSKARHMYVKYIQEDSGNEVVLVISQNGSVSYNCTYYQWGRKDPMVPAILESGTATPADKTLYNLSGSVITRPANINGVTSIGVAIQNPGAFVVGGSSGNSRWLNTRRDNLWNTNVTQMDITNDSRTAKDIFVNKTVYDPCPPGFKTPNRNAFTGFSKTGTDVHWQFQGAPLLTYDEVNVENLNTFNTLLGYAFYLDPTDYTKGTVFFHRSGSRHPSNGNVVGVGTYSDINTACVWGPSNTSGYRCYTTFSNNYLLIHWGGGTCYGFPTRPIGE